MLAVPIFATDSLAYGRTALVPLNTILYNVLGRARGVSPELYGTEPWTYYLATLALGFGPAALLALSALPAVAIAARRDPARLGAAPGSAPLVLLALRLCPFYLWLGVLSAQAHKEERFMYPVYSLVCFNAAVAVFVVRAGLEHAYLRITRSPYKASRTWLFAACTAGILLAPAACGVLRLAALTQHYSAPMRVLDALPDAPARVCFGKEWHRFPSHFFLPPRAEAAFVRSAFTGILPHKFESGPGVTRTHAEATAIGALERIGVRWPWPETRTVPRRVNEFNRDEPDRYVDMRTCDYFVDASTGAPPGPEWAPVTCVPFVDGDASRLAAHTMPRAARAAATLARTLWLPHWAAERLTGAQALQYAPYCLYRRS